MREVSFGSSDKLEIRGKTVSGFLLQALIVHATDNTAFAAQPLDLSKVNVKAVLTRNRKSTVIFSDVLGPLAFDSAFYSGNFDQMLEVATIAYQRVVAAAASTRERLVISCPIRLHDVINLKGDDVLTLEVNPLADSTGATVDDTQSKFYFDYVEGIGNAMSVPVIRAHSIRASLSMDKFSLGDEVVGVKFINTDKTGITTANQVISSVSIDSDKFTGSNPYEELLTERAAQFQSHADHALRNQCFDLLNVRRVNFGGQDVRLNDVDVTINFVSGNVNTSKNWIVVRSYANDVLTARRAVERGVRHASENSKQYYS